jgi:tripartite ATP-independent transporter DctM subunit
MEAIIVFTIFGILLVAGMPIPIAIVAPGLIYLIMTGGFGALRGLGLVSWGSTNSFTLTAVPMFILMSQILMESGLSDKVYRGLSKVLARVPGGLVQTNIAGCAILAATTGSSVATAASIGSVALPQLIERRYDARLAAGSLAAGGTLGILIPPSLAMVIYGSFTETSVAQLFMAGVVPGLLLTLLFMVYVAFHSTFIARTHPIEEPVDLAGRVKALGEILPFALLIGGTLGSMYFGLVTPTEAAAIGSVLAAVISAIWGDLTWRGLYEAFRGTVAIVGSILFIVFAALVFSYAISLARIGEEVTQFIIGLGLSKLEFYVVAFVLYMVMGCLIETMGMIVITVPLIFPVILAYGIDPVWFGIVLVIFVELGQIHPPLGINLLVIQSLWKGRLIDVVLGTIPFQLLMILLLVLMAIWPDIALWLPRHMIAASP